MDPIPLYLLGLLLILIGIYLFGTTEGSRYGWVKYQGRSTGGPIWFIFVAVGLGIIIFTYILSDLKIL